MSANRIWRERGERVRKIKAERRGETSDKLKLDSERRERKEKQDTSEVVKPNVNIGTKQAYQSTKNCITLVIYSKYYENENLLTVKCIRSVQWQPIQAINSSTVPEIPTFKFTFFKVLSLSSALIQYFDTVLCHNSTITVVATHTDGRECFSRLGKHSSSVTTCALLTDRWCKLT